MLREIRLRIVDTGSLERGRARRPANFFMVIGTLSKSKILKQIEACGYELHF